MDKPISSTEAARILGVSASSIKRWADSGVLPCVKTHGRHRRFDPEVVRAFNAPPAEEPSEGRPGADSSPFLELLLDAPAPITLVANLMEERSRLGAWWRVAESLGPVLKELGEQWAAGELTVLEEHRASERLARALARCTETLPQSDTAPRCLLTTATGELHTLGLVLLELCLLEAGWSVQWSGSRTPLPEVITLVERHLIDMVAVSASVASQDGRALEAEVRSLEEVSRPAGVTLLLGGDGAWPDELHHAHRLRSFRGLAALLEHLGSSKGSL